MEVPERVLEELTPLSREQLVAQGVDLDTLPTSAEIAVGGSARAEITLQGGLGGFQGEGSLDFQDLLVRTDYVRSGEMTFSLEGFPGDTGRIQARLRSDSVNIRSLGFLSGEAEVDLGWRDGRVRVTASRSPTERYSAGGTFALDSLGGGNVNLDQLTLEFDSVRWNLGGPASFAWSRDGYRIRDLQLIRPGTGAMRFRADGFLPFEGAGETAFQVNAENLDLARVARTVQMETPMEGVVDFRARMTGSPGDPEITGTASGAGVKYGDLALDSLYSEFGYGDERVDIDLVSLEEGRQVLAMEGSFPADLRLEPDSLRVPRAPVDLTIQVDSFPAATALAFLDALEDVEGTLSGDLRFGGSTADLEPRGTLFLADGSATFPDLGVRHREVNARFDLSSDGVVEIDGTVQSDGRGRVAGRVTLTDPLSDPSLDLQIETDNFLAVSRRDVRAHLSGSVSIEGRYRRPVVMGELTVERGVMEVEEVARSVEVVDLSHPGFFDVVGTELVTLRPIIQSSQNPFLQNLRLEAVSLTMDRGSWLRGRDLNVEMAGNLDVFWDRTENTFTFLGVLDAVRGVYSVLGRQFQVEEGTVSFPGIPGINPDLDIRAVNRIRTTGGDQLEIIATVEGSLLEPRVTLSSDSPFPIAESDLVSYLVFGQPSYALSQGGGSAPRTREAFAGATTSLAVGLFSTELGTLLAQDVGLDYLAITQNPDFSSRGERTGNYRATTHVEMGQYLTQDIFAALLWRPWTNSNDQKRLASVRLETRLTDRWTLEGYWEDRFLRGGLYGLGSTLAETGGLEGRVLGFFLYRDWGY
jgi:translocation and assembly module TamB